MADESKETEIVGAGYELPIDVVERSEMLYAGSEETSGYAYQIRTDDRLKDEIAPALRDLKENEHLFIEYRKWLDGEENEHDFSAYIMKQNKDGSYSRSEDLNTRFNQTRTDRLADGDMVSKLKAKIREYVQTERQGQTIDDGIEQTQANGGMSEAAMEAEITAEKNPRPDYLDEQGNPHWFDEEGTDEPIDMAGYEFADYIHSDEFISKFGDWEKANRLEKLKSDTALEYDESVIVEGSDISDLVHKLRKNFSKNNLKQLSEIAKDVGQEILNDLRSEQKIDQFSLPAITNIDSGKEIKLQMKGIREISEHNVFQVGHIEAIRHIPELIKTAIYISQENNEDGRDPSLKQFFYFAKGIKIDDKDYTAKLVFAQNQNGELFYDQSLSTIEKGKLVDLIKNPSQLTRIIPQDRLGRNGVLNPQLSQENSPDDYYDKRLVRICQVPQMPYMEQDAGGAWRPTKEAVALVKDGLLHIEKDGQEYVMIDSQKIKGTERASSQVVENPATEHGSSRTNIVADNAYLVNKKDFPQHMSDDTALETAVKEKILGASELLKSLDVNGENYKQLLPLLDEIETLAGKKPAVTVERQQTPPSEEVSGQEEPESAGETAIGQGSDAPSVSNESAKTVVYGKTVLPAFSVDVNGEPRLFEGCVVQEHDKKTGMYLLDNGSEKVRIPSKTFESILQPEPNGDVPVVTVQGGRAIVEGRTKIPPFAMITQHGLENFDDMVLQGYNKADGTYLLADGEKTLAVPADLYAELTEEPKFKAQEIGEDSPAYKRLPRAQYDWYFRESENNSTNFRHNLAVYCRKEANSPVDALQVVTEIVSRMPKTEQQKTRAWLETLAAKNGESVNETIIGMYHEAVREVPLAEEYMKAYQPKDVIVRKFYDTVSSDGARVDGNFDLRIGDTLRNVRLRLKNPFGDKEDMYQDLKVVSASKEGNSITLMDGDKSFYTLPRDSVLNGYAKQQKKEQKIERRKQRSNALDISY